MKTKYAVPQALIDDLMRSGMASDEEEALEKVASGEALDALKESKVKELYNLEIEFKHTDGRGIYNAERIDELKEGIEELNELIALRNASED
jgi:hypothetical protein